MKNKLFLFFFIIVLSACFFSGCQRKNETSQYRMSILIFITGIVTGNPPYEMLTQGALEFANENPDINIKIYEAGINQAGWEQQLKEMISGGEYDVVISSNPSMPDICINASLMFPNQKFIILDAQYEGHPAIRTYNYNQYEQSLFLGYLAGLITVSDMPFTNNQKRIGFIAAQEYPLLTREMVPGFIEGARLVDPQIELDMRVVGNWADAARAAELTSAMMNSGVDVFTAIAGGAAQGLIRTAVERGAYLVWYNTNAYDMAAGFILGCGIMEQKKLVMEVLNDVADGKMQYGISATIGVKEGYIGFIFDDPGYQNHLPADIRAKFETFMDDYFADPSGYESYRN